MNNSLRTIHATVAMSLNFLGHLLRDQGRLAEAETTHREALAMRMRLFGNENLRVAESLGDLAGILWLQGKRSESESLATQALAMVKKFGKEDSETATILHGFGNVLHQAGELEKAEVCYREVLAIRRKILGNENADTQWVISNLGQLLLEKGNLAEAESLCREALATRKKILGETHPNTQESRHQLAEVLSAEGKLAEEEALVREALENYKKLPGTEDVSRASAMHTLADLLQRQSKFAEAAAFYHEALAIRRKLLDKEHPDTAGTLHNLADTLRQEGKLDEAEAFYREALAMRRKLLGNEDPATQGSLRNLADLLLKEAKLDEAEALSRGALAVARKAWPNDPARWDGPLEEVLLREGKYDEIEQIYNELLTPALQSQPQGALVLGARGDFRARLSRWKEAVEDFSKAVELNPDDPKNWNQLALLLLQSGDLASYRQCCQQMLARFGGTKDPATAEWMAKTCLILPPPGADLETIGKLAELAVISGQSHPQLGWFQFAKGWAEYRQGRSSNAVEWMQKVLAKTGHVYRETEAHMVLAMARHQLKQADEARAALTKGVELAETKLPGPASGDLGGNWVDVLIGRALMIEAKVLIEGK